MNEVVVDAASFILWAEVSFLKTIIEYKLFSILLTKEVLDELKDSSSLSYVKKGLEGCIIKQINIDKQEQDKIKVKYRLGKGEISCIAFCSKHNKILVTDDLQAQKKAENEGLNVKNTNQIVTRFIKEKSLFNTVIKKFKSYYPKRFANL